MSACQVSSSNPTSLRLGCLATRNLPSPANESKPPSEKPRKSRERKGDKWLLRQQPEGKKKHRDSQRRANHDQRHELSKPSPGHDTQRQPCLTPMHSTTSAVIARWAQTTSFYDNGNSSPLPNERMYAGPGEPSEIIHPGDVLEECSRRCCWTRNSVHQEKTARGLALRNKPMGHALSGIARPPIFPPPRARPVS